MRAWNLVYLAVGLAAGVGVGFLLANAPRKPGRASSPRIDLPPQPTPRPEEVIRSGAPREAAPSEIEFAKPVDAAPDLKGGCGRIEVVLDEEWSVMVRAGHTVSIAELFAEAAFDGGPDRADVGWDEARRIAAVDLKPGAYTVYWYEGESNRLRVHRGEVRTGLVTRIDGRPRSEGREYPIPEGKGRLEVFVAGLDSEALPAARVWVYVPDLEGYEWQFDRTTDASGNCWFHFAPGAVRVQVGSRFEKAKLRAGETTRLEVRYEQEGELRIESTSTFPCVLTDAQGKRRYAFNHWSHFSAERGVEWGFIYLPPGSYEVRSRFHEPGVSLGWATVSTGRRTVLQYEPPLGGIYVRVLRKGSEALTRNAVIVATGGQGSIQVPIRWNSATEGRHCGNAEFARIDPGLYRVEIRAEGLRAAPLEVEVLDKRITIDLEVEAGKRD